MRGKYLEQSVSVMVNKDSTLYEKMRELAKVNNISMEAVVTLLVTVGLEEHMEKNADEYLGMDG